jgi:hypothetical protein
MGVWVRCGECGAEHPSRFRASNREQFSWLDPFLGPLLEPCPVCGRRPLVAEREWRDGPVPSPWPFPGLVHARRSLRRSATE